MNVDIKISNQNLLEWSHMEDWVNGAAAAPTEHTLAGASATVAREATLIKAGTYSAKVTRVGADTTLYHDHVDYSDYQGRKVTFGCWVYATVASRARIGISDGVGSTNSSYHSGGSSWEYLEVTHNMNTAATRMRAEMHVNTGNTSGYFDGGVLCQGDSSITILTDYTDIGKWKVVNKYVSSSYSVPRRAGTKVPNYRINSKSLSSEGMVVGTTPTTKRTAFDTLMKALNSYINKPDGDIENKNLYFYDDRYYKCLVTTDDSDEIAAARISNMKFKFDVYDPFIYAVNKTRVNQALAGTTAFTVTSTGTAVSYPKIAVTNNSSNIVSIIIENLTTGQKISYSGTLATGKILVINTEDLTVENDGTGDLGNVTNEIGILLVPGGNQFLITGVASGSVNVDWFNRWY